MIGSVEYVFNNSQDYPRLLMIDMTPVGHLSATGQIKKTFLGNWSSDSFLQIWSLDEKFGTLSLLRVNQTITESQSKVYSPGEVIDKAIALDSDVALLKLSLKDEALLAQQLSSEVDSLNSYLIEKESQIVDMNSEMTSLINEFNLSKSNSEKLQIQLAALQENLNAAEVHNFGLSKERELLKKDNKAANENEARLKKAIMDQRGQIQELEELIKSIEKSYTFRVGKAIVGPFGKLKNVIKNSTDQ